MGIYQKLIYPFVFSFFILAFSIHASTIEGKISKNVDGDTVWVTDNAGEIFKIRMMEIDAPEWHMPSPNGIQAQGTWGEIAGRYMEKLIPKGTVVSVRNYGKDHYGRTLGTIFVKGEDINLKMAKSGWAIPYIYCGPNEYENDYFQIHDTEAYLEACRNARMAQKGVFDPGHLLTEMPFEFRMRVTGRKPEKWVGDYMTKKFYRPDQYKKVDVCARIFFSSSAEAKRAGFRAAPNAEIDEEMLMEAEF